MTPKPGGQLIVQPAARVFVKKRRAGENDPSPESRGEGMVSLTLDACGHAPRTATAVVDDELGVRRLTPLECERLQGFPDGHTGGQSDSVRYRQLGNAVAVPVVEWIAHRLVAVDQT